MGYPAETTRPDVAAARSVGAGAAANARSLSDGAADDAARAMAAAAPGAEDGILDDHDRNLVARGKHIIDILIEERAPTLVSSPFWPLYRSVLYPLLKEPRAKRMADGLVGLSGAEAMDRVTETLALSLTTSGLENVPAHGRALIASTHPTGIADGVAMYEALRDRRRDLLFFANRDALRVSPRFGELMIPVEWKMEKRTRQRSRETLVATKNAFESDSCVVLFPSGRLAYMDENRSLTEQEWMSSIAIFARKYECPVVPAHIEARNSWLYYWFRNLSPELRDITLFNELLNKRGKRFHITFGPMISPDDLAGDPTEVTNALRRHALEDVRAGAPWTPVEQAEPVDA
ncbi:MAG: 1-acyl-sn-glycerol-3-phosphate acyltransferase [Parvularculaceae bacterium]